MDWLLIVLQGFKVEEVFQQIVNVVDMWFMDVVMVVLVFGELWVLWLGYIGEDGFEVLVEISKVDVLCCVLLDYDVVEVIGFGVWDSLWFEVGLCFYGLDIDVIILLIEVDLVWVI